MLFLIMLTSLHLRMKNSEVCIKTRSLPASLPIQGQVTKHTTVKWPIASQNINSFTNNKIVTYNAWQQENPIVGCIQLITFSDVQSRLSYKSTSAFRFHFFQVRKHCLVFLSTKYKVFYELQRWWASMISGSCSLFTPSGAHPSHNAFSHIDLLSPLT